MTTLRELARTDRAIGNINSAELRLIAAVLTAAAGSRLFRLLLPKDLRQPLPMRMLASTLSRAPDECEPESLQVAIFREMQKGKL